MKPKPAYTVKQWAKVDGKDFLVQTRRFEIAFAAEEFARTCAEAVSESPLHHTITVHHHDHATAEYQAGGPDMLPGMIQRIELRSPQLFSEPPRSVEPDPVRKYGVKFRPALPRQTRP